MENSILTAYRPINCDLYDQLEIYAMQATLVLLHYTRVTDEESKIQIRIKNLQTRDKSEFILTDCGKAIRLDQIIAISPALDE